MIWKRWNRQAAKRSYRLRYLKDPRAIALVEAMKKQCNWQAGRAHRNAAAAFGSKSPAGSRPAAYTHAVCPAARQECGSPYLQHPACAALPKPDDLFLQL